MHRRVAWTLAVAAALALRLAIVETWHVPGGDGIQYYRLSQTLRQLGRYAFGARPEPPSYSRLPGYPLFLAHVAVRKAPVSIQEHLLPATRANAVLDILTACLVAVVLSRLAGRLPGPIGSWVWLPWVGFVGVIATPSLLLLSGYAMTETLATFLATLEVALALLALEGQLVVAAAGAGLVAGLAQLVRADALTFAPAVALAIFSAPRPWRARLLAALACVVTAGAVFSPWPVRNLHVFGKPHPFAAYWRTRDDGKPLPGGFIAWARTWGTGDPGESYVDLQMALENPITDDVLLSQMWDDEVERTRVTALFQRYNAEGLSSLVDHEFALLAKERRARAPLRTWVTLPLKRLRRMWAPLPYYELPMQVPWLWIGKSRAYFWGWRLLVGALALAGAVFLLRDPATRAIAAVLVLPIVVRSLLLCSTIAIGATERHLVEIQPLVVVLGAAGLGWLRARLRALLSGQRAAQR